MSTNRSGLGGAGNTVTRGLTTAKEWLAMNATHVTGDTPKIDETREPVAIGDVLAEALPQIKKRVQRTAPLGATLSIPLSSYSETTLGDLRDLLDLAERLPDSDVVNVYVPMDPKECGSISIIVGCEARA